MKRLTFLLIIYSLIHKPTRIKKTSASLIDHIYTNNILSNTISGIIASDDIADHYGIFYIVPHKIPCTTLPTTEKRIFSKIRITRFKTYLEQIDFLPVTLNDNPEDAYCQFHSIYKKAFDIHFPLENVKANKKYIKKEHWMTEGLLTSMRNKSKLYKIKSSRPTENNINIYKTYVNKYNRLKREMKKMYYKNILELNKNNMKNTWHTLKQVLGKEHNKSNFPQFFQIDDNKISDKNLIAQSFNEYFSKIGKTTSENVPRSNKPFTEYIKHPKLNSIFIEPINASHILEIVHKLKPKTSFGHDEIPTKLIKETIEFILDPLTHIINRSLETGIVPSDLKIAKVIPIYKTSTHNLLKNYRPISLLPAFSKIFEKIMYNKIMSFLNSQNLLYKHQYGFRPKHQTIHPLIHLLNHCAQASNKQPKQLTLSIFCDLSKAFDVISHDILLCKLKYYGIRGIANTWISNYLTNRKQYVEFEKHKSDMCNIKCGVPQGSIFGPLLYLIYVNDISASTDYILLSFADDTSLYLSDSNIDTLFQTANVEINNLYDWFCANRLSLNANKTKFIVIRPPNLKCEFAKLNIKINGVCLQQIGKHTDECSTKFLGVHIDEHLSWKYHFNHINNKISRALFMLKQVKNFLLWYISMGQCKQNRIK